MAVTELQSLTVSVTFLAVLPKATQGRSLFLALYCTALALAPVLHGHSH